MGKNVLYRRFDEDPPRIVLGDGFYLESSEGERFLDLSGGPGVACLGYSNAFVIETLKKQMDKICFAFSGTWASNPAEIAANLIADQFEEARPGWLGKVLFQGSGSESVDLACKLASQYAAEGGQSRDLFAALEYSFHGVTTLPYAMTGDYPRYGLVGPYHGKVRAGHVLRIRNPYDCDPDTALANTQQIFKTFGEKVAAVIVEPVGGPPVGATPQPEKYLLGIRQLCDTHGCLLIYDEVFCGSGRCGVISCAELTGVWPDIIILGKSLNGGYQPTSAICISKKVAERIAAGSGVVMWGTTYGAHTLGCAAVAAVQKYVINHKLLQRVRDEASLFESITKTRLEDACAGLVTDLQATGFLFGFKFQDPRTGKGFPEEAGFHALVRRVAQAHGVIFYTKGGTIKGQGDFGILAPPFEMDAGTYLEGVTGLAKAVHAAYQEYLEGQHA